MGKMERIHLLACLLAVLVTCGLSRLAAAEPKDSEPDRIHGFVHTHDEDGYTFALRVRGSDVHRTVIYGRDTPHSYRGEDSSIEMVREGWRVICLGRFDDKGRLKAHLIDQNEAAGAADAFGVGRLRAIAWCVS